MQTNVLVDFKLLFTFIISDAIIRAIFFITSGCGNDGNRGNRDILY